MICKFVCFRVKMPKPNNILYLFIMTQWFVNLCVSGWRCQNLTTFWTGSSWYWCHCLTLCELCSQMVGGVLVAAFLLQLFTTFLCVPHLDTQELPCFALGSDWTGLAVLDWVVSCFFTCDQSQIFIFIFIMTLQCQDWNKRTNVVVQFLLGIFLPCCVSFDLSSSNLGIWFAALYCCSVY